MNSVNIARGTKIAAPATLFLIGAQKSGTTSLAACLESHPQITCGVSKELNVLGCHDEENRLSRYTSWNKPEATVRMDASTCYFHFERSLERIAEISAGTARVLIILRHPVERAVSAYYHHVANGVDLRSPEQAFACILSHSSDGSPVAALARESDNLRSAIIAGDILIDRYLWRFPDPAWGLRYVKNSCYVPRLRAVYERFDRKQVAVIFMDDFRADQRKTVLSVLEFLQLDPSGLKHPAKDVRANQTLLPAESLTSRLLRRVRRAIPPGARTLVPSAVVAGYRRRAFRPPKAMAPDIRGQLASVLHCQYEELEDVLETAIPPSWRECVQPG